MPYFVPGLRVLTLLVGHGRHPVHDVCHGNAARLENVFVQLLLLKFVELRLQLVVVEWIADRVRRDGVDNLFAERILFSKFLPTALIRMSASR